MKIIINVAHPAHVHLFKNMIWNLEGDGHEIKITAKHKEVTLNLLNAYGFRYDLVGKARRGLINKAMGVLEIDWKLLKIANKFKPDVLIGVHDESIAHVGWFIKKPSMIFTDTEHAKLGNLLTFPFATAICTPSCFKKDLGKKQVRYNGYHELAYLHPNYFKPNPEVLDEVGLTKNDKFFILRFVSWSASHDIGQKGFIDKGDLIKKLEEHGRVFITSEKPLSKELERCKIIIPPEKIHDLVYYATMYIGEGATMASEAAVLGIPSLYVNSLPLGYISEESEKYRLVYIFPDPEKGQVQALQKALELLEDKNLKNKWQDKREKLLKDKIDVTKWMTDFIENYPESFVDIKRQQMHFDSE